MTALGPDAGAPLRAVLIDVGGVLVMPSHGLVRSVAARFGVGRGRDAGALFDAHYLGVEAGERATVTGGAFDWHSYRCALLRAAGVPAPLLDRASEALAPDLLYGRACEVWSEELPGARDGLLALASTGLVIGVVSNSDGTVAEMLSSRGLCQIGEGPGCAVAVVADSAVVGVSKPDPAIFAAALEAAGVDAAEAVHVGDTVYADVVGARAAGVRPLHLDPLGWCGASDHEHVANLVSVAELVAGGRVT